MNSILYTILMILALLAYWFSAAVVGTVILLIAAGYAYVITKGSFGSSTPLG